MDAEGRYGMVVPAAAGAWQNVAALPLYQFPVPLDADQRNRIR